MTFWKITDKRMNCLITQAEIKELGYELSDLTQDRERTAEFLEILLQKGQEALGLDISNGVQSFYGAFLPDNSLLLSISCADIEEEIAEEEQKKQRQRPLLTESDDELSSFQVVFSSLDHVIQFCEIFGKGKAASSRLYEYNGEYYLLVAFDDSEAGKRAARGIITAEEFEGMVEHNLLSETFLQEHEACMIAEGAIEKLCDMNA